MGLDMSKPTEDDVPLDDKPLPIPVPKIRTGDPDQPENTTGPGGNDEIRRPGLKARTRVMPVKTGAERRGCRRNR